MTIPILSHLKDPENPTVAKAPAASAARQAVRRPLTGGFTVGPAPRQPSTGGALRKNFR